MAYKYDFDMFSIIPEGVRQQFQGELSDLGMEQAAGAQRALFRDPALVEALRSADKVVQDLFLEAGFGLNVYDSGAPDGRYPGRDEVARNACLQKFTDALSASKNLKALNWGGFDLVEFLDYIIDAKPIGDVEMQAPIDDVEMHVTAGAGQRQEKRKSLARVGLMAGGAMIVVSVAGILTGLVGS